jgi:hypothetical protein
VAFIDPGGDFALLLDVVFASSIREILSGIQSNVGFALLDQVRYGGDAGLKSLIKGAAIQSAVIAVRLLAGGALLRRAQEPVYYPPGTVDPGALNQSERRFAQKIIDKFGGDFVGPPLADQPGVDGAIFANGRPLPGAQTSDLRFVQLKQSLGSMSLETVINGNFRQAFEKAAKAGYYDVDLYIETPNFSRQQILQWIQGGKADLQSFGVIGDIRFLANDGWIVIPRGGS